MRLGGNNMKCPHCGKKIKSGNGRCPYCGGEIHYGGNTRFVVKSARAELTIRDLFSDALKKHPPGAGARMFIAGTPGAIPTPDRMLQEWNKPWLFTRVIGVGLLFAFMSYLMQVAFGHDLGYVLLFTLGALVIPLGILVFYWEISIPRDIPIYTVFFIFLIGGMMSLFFTLMLPSGGIAPLAEEPGKVIALAIFLYSLRSEYIFDGLLIGAAVGAGFSAFENIFYAVVKTHYSMDTLIMRSLLTIGGHVTWAAIEGGALAWAKGNTRLQLRHFMDGRFLRYFLATIGLHFLWNLPFGLLPLPLFADLKFVLLSVAAVYLSFSLIKKAIAEILAVADSVASKPLESQDNRTPIRTPPQLLVLYGPMSGSVIPLTSRIIIGRDPSKCNFVLPPEAQKDGVSRVHCAVEPRGGNVYVMDLGSTYGTYLAEDNRKIPANRWIKVTGQFFLGSKKVRFSANQ